MIETTALISLIAWFTTSLIKRAAKKKANDPLFKRALPLIPVACALGLTFVPPFGLVALPLATKIAIAISAGTAAGSGHEVLKKTILGRKDATVSDTGKSR